MQRKVEEALGKPTLELGGFRIWVHGRQYPESKTFWDGNWWRTTINCSSKNSSVEVCGDLLHGSELASWLEALVDVRETGNGCAVLDTMEPYLRVEIRAETYQRFSLCVNITPSRGVEKHYFEFWVDEIEGLMDGCRAALTLYPIVGTPRDHS
jgi:hypothetical protein